METETETETETKTIRIETTGETKQWACSHTEYGEDCIIIPFLGTGYSLEAQIHSYGVESITPSRGTCPCTVLLQTTPLYCLSVVAAKAGKCPEDFLAA